MSQYTTGELAKLCDVSVRTVQFYDKKDLLKPSELTQGGRRLYSEDDLSRMRLICMLKSLGLTLDSIKGILDSQTPNKILSLLLQEQCKGLKQEIAEKQKQLCAVEAVMERIGQSKNIPVNSIDDIKQAVNSKKILKRTHITMLVLGIIMDIIQIAGLVLWIVKGIWLPFVVGLPFVIAMGIISTWVYVKNTAFICPECSVQFKPALKGLLFSSHTPKTRKLSCPSCGYRGWCVEVASNKN